MSANNHQNARFPIASGTSILTGKPNTAARLKTAFLLPLGLVTLASLAGCVGDQNKLASAINASYHTNFSSPVSADQISSAK